MHIYRYSAENHDFFPQIFMKMPKNGKWLFVADSKWVFEKSI